MLDMQVIILLT